MVCERAEKVAVENAGIPSFFRTTRSFVHHVKESRRAIAPHDAIVRPTTRTYTHTYDS
jgi:hypothetical protein